MARIRHRWQSLRRQKLPEVVTEVFRQFLATNFPVRVKAIASEIFAKKPDLIGLQEVEVWQLEIPNLGIVTYDFVELLLIELKEIGLDYKIAAQNRNYSAQLPDSTEIQFGYWIPT